MFVKYGRRALSAGVGIGLVVAFMNIDIPNEPDQSWYELQSASAQNAAKATDRLPMGRKAAAIVEGKYPANYFPNSELLGSVEMRITALGARMPNQTRAAISISYLVELGNGDG